MTPPTITAEPPRPALPAQRGSRLQRRATIGAIAALLGATAVAQQSTARVAPESVGLSPARLTEATELLKREIAQQHIAGAVAAVARRGRVGYLEALGVQDLETRVPMRERSLFRIYSMTKSITAVAVMMLHEQKRFTLDDPIPTFIPEFRDIRVIGEPGEAHAPARPITVRDLLMHTSGLNHRTSEIYRREQVRSRTSTMAQFIANLVRVGLMEDPGTRYRYSEATTVLGRLVEIWSGQPFDVFLETRILGPLKMHDTMFAALTADQRARLTTVYGAAPGGGLTKVETETVPFTERNAKTSGIVLVVVMVVLALTHDGAEPVRRPPPAPGRVPRSSRRPHSAAPRARPKSSRPVARSSSSGVKTGST